MYGLYGIKHYTVEISGDVTDPDKQTTTTRKHRATQLLICEKLSLAIKLGNPHFHVDSTDKIVDCIPPRGCEKW